jgi:flagellar hook-associated protein 1 FlgK
MSLNGALQVGRSGIVAAQTGLQVTGHNMANAATEGYTRQVVRLAPARGEVISGSQTIGLGVRVQAITRQIDTALLARYRDAIADEQGATIDQRFLTQIETIQNELSDNDLSTLLSEFFNSFSEVANSPNDNAVRSVALQQGVNLADRVTQMRSEYARLRDEIDGQLDASVGAVSDILDQLSLVNRQIAETEQGVGQANSLRDQRDRLVTQLAEFMDVSAIEQPNGAVDVFVGSTPIVLAGQTRGIAFRADSKGDGVEVSIRVAADGSRLDINSGRLGALLRQRDAAVEPAIDDLDQFAAQLIFQVNRLHSQGQGLTGRAAFEGHFRVEDTSANLNSTDADLPFRIENGSFFIHVTHAASGVRTTHQINIDGDAMSLEDLIDEINTVVGVPNVTAGLSANNEFTLTAAAGYEISFSDDSSGALAALGMNTLFTGRNASDIAVNDDILDEPGLLAAGSGHVDGSNGTARAIADLQDAAIDDLNGRSLREFWQQSVNRVAVRADAANGAVESSRLVRESISGQLQAVSGVSLDEEAVNLLTYQRQFQAAARFISVIDETLQTLLSLT